MIGTFEDGQHYRFYQALTAQILALVEQLKCQDGLRYRGMDFSHAFESELYFATVMDQALNSMEAGLDPDRERPFSSALAVLLARHWFGEAASRPFERRRSAPLALLRAVKRALDWRFAWTSTPPKIAQAAMPLRSEILLYARSERFAAYLVPISEKLRGRCSYLVPSQAHALQQELAFSGTPFIAAGKARARPRPYSVIGQYAPHLAFFADGVEDVLRTTRPRVILLPEGNSSDDEVVNQVGKKLGIPVICLQQGWSPIVHPGFCNLDYATMLVWGPGFSELLAKTNPKQRFAAVGNYALAADFRPAHEKPAGILFFHQDVDRGLGGRRGSEMILDLAGRIAEARPDVPVYYRPHPLVPLEASTRARLEQRNIKIQLPQNCSLADALSQANITVSIYSTTLLESAASGSLPIIFNMSTLPRFWPDMAGMGAAIEVRTTEDAMAALEKLLSDQSALAAYVPAMRIFSDRFFCARGNQALDNIIQVLSRFL